MLLLQHSHHAWADHHHRSCCLAATLQGSCHYKDVYSMKWYAAYPDTLDGFAGSW